MSLPELFLEEAQHQDTAMISLPHDMDSWAETLVSKVREKIPTSKDMEIRVSILHKDEELGTSTGAITITNKKLNKSIYLPLITKDFKLFPLDIMLVPNLQQASGFEVLPLTKEGFDDLMTSHDPFDHLGKPYDRLRQLYGDSQGRLVFPPHYRNIYASTQILDSLKGTVWKQDVKEVMENLRQNPQTLIGYEKRANLFALQKLATLVEGGEVHVPLKNITLIQKDLDSNFKVMTTSDAAYDPIIESISEDELKNRLKDHVEDCADKMHEVRKNGETMIFDGLKPMRDVMVYGGQRKENYLDVDKKPVEVITYGTYKVQDKNGVFHTGIVIPNVIDFEMKILPLKIFRSPIKSAVQDRIPGIKCDSGRSKEYLEFRSPQVGMTGSFVAHNKTNAIATMPITIKSIFDDCGETHIVGMDLNGRKIKLKYSGCEYHSLTAEREKTWSNPVEIKQIVRIKDFYLLPNQFKFLPMDNFTNLAEMPEEVIQKQASMTRDASPIRVIHTGLSQFSLKGNDIIKMASRVGWDATNLSGHKAVFLLASKQCPMDKIAEAIRTAHTYGESSIHGLGRTIYGEEIHKSQVKLASSISKLVRSLRVNLIKEASYFDDSQIVDAALSLNFINPENIDKFVGFIPVFEQTTKYLAEAVLASRLGISEIPAQAASTAMLKLTDVVRGLRKLKIQKED